MRLSAAAALLLVLAISCILPEDVSGHWTNRKKPIYSRRLSLRQMGKLYFKYASRYPEHFWHKMQERLRKALEEEKRRRELKGRDDDHDDDDDDDDRDDYKGKNGEFCVNNLALPNGSYVGRFQCPFLNSERPGWTKCCGFKNEEFCCDPSYDDSWAHHHRWTALAAIGVAALCLLLLAAALAALVYVHCRLKKKARVGDSVVNLKATKAATGQSQTATACEKKLPPEENPDFGFQRDNPIFFTQQQQQQQFDQTDLPGYAQAVTPQATGPVGHQADAPPAYDFNSK